MSHSLKILASTVAIATLLGTPVLAQVKTETFAQLNVDQKVLATGYRTSKIVGSSVINKAGETIGTVDDLIINPNDKIPFAVLSVGGFLGIGTKYVVVPYGSFSIKDQKMMLSDATKQSLKDLPEFKYSS